MAVAPGLWPVLRVLDALTDHFYPDVVEDNHRVDPPAGPEDGYHLSEDLVDHAISYINDQVSIKPEQPYFMYVAFGTAHCPHQAPQEYLDKYKGVYNVGWDEIRRQRFERQKASGMVPPEAELARLNPGVKQWDTLSADEQRLFARFQEAYAAMVDHTDAQLDRLINYIESIGRLDNTIVIVLSDNGASQEGGPDGGVDIVTYEEDRFCTVDFNLEKLETIGGPDSQTNIPWGWAQAANTPLKWYKQNTYAGGLRTPMVISWPEGISDAGAVRSQFVHAIDIAPTLFDLLDVGPPETYRGIDQMPIHGASIRHILTDANSPAPRSTQYFEMIGHRAIWQDGWKALTRHRRNEPFEDDPWELYRIDTDFSECHDLATEEPERLAELVDLWSAEASKYGVFPLDDRYLAVRASSYQTPNSPRGRDEFTYLAGMTRVPGSATPLVFNRSFRITATVGMTAGTAQGVLVSVGDVSGGYVLYVRDGRLIFDYNYLGTRQLVSSEVAVPPGTTQLAFDFERTADHEGVGRLLADADVIGEAPMTGMARAMLSWGGLTLGADGLSPVSDAYHGDFPYSGGIEQVTFKLGAVGELGAVSR